MSRPPQAEAHILGPATTTKEVKEALAELDELLPSLAAAPPARSLRARALLRLLRQSLLASPEVFESIPQNPGGRLQGVTARVVCVEEAFASQTKKGKLVHSGKWARPCASNRNSAAVAQAVVVMQANVLVASINEANKALSDHAREA